MKYGIQVNIGPPGAPDWRWLQQHDMSSGEWDSKDKATAKMLEWHPKYERMIMSKPLFPMLASIHPVYKLIMLVTAPIAEFECFTQRYLKVLRTLNEQ